VLKYCASSATQMRRSPHLKRAVSPGPDGASICEAARFPGWPGSAPLPQALGHPGPLLWMPLLSGLATGFYDVKIAVFLEDVPIL
jgi:hypothetical protein